MTTTTTTNRKLPRGKRWTYADYCRIPPDRKRHEIIDGRHFVSPSPSPFHQWIQVQLLVELCNRIGRTNLGRVFSAPLDVHLGRGTVVQPDIVVLVTTPCRVETDKKISGAPDLLIEVLSPSTRTHDRKRKFERYQRAGVREFWIVDPSARRIEQFVLQDGRYGEPVVATDRIRLHILPQVEFDLAIVWDPGRTS
ncbi:MAG: Uma2 family endonuclease [Planctomycetes bacterium]|nr:Uma2 family endonuclease [Planctomycetota bacterium]